MVYLFLTPLQQNSGHHIPFPQPENLKSRVPFFPEKLATLLFSGLPLLGPLYSKTPATTSHSHSLNTSKVESLFFPKNWQLYFSVVYLFLAFYSKTPATTSHSHSLKTSKVESLFFPKNWQLHFSVVYLFLTPLQQNPGHYIPFPQPENLKSRVPFFSEKLATLLFSGLPLLDPSTAKLRPLHPIPTARKPQK